MVRKGANERNRTESATNNQKCSTWSSLLVDFVEKPKFCEQLSERPLNVLNGLSAFLLIFCYQNKKINSKALSAWANHATWKERGSVKYIINVCRVNVIMINLRLIIICYQLSYSWKFSSPISPGSSFPISNVHRWRKAPHSNHKRLCGSQIASIRSKIQPILP